MIKLLGRIWRIIWKTFIAFFIMSIVFVVIYRWIPVPITPLMVIRNIEQLGDGKGIVMEHDWVPLEEISPKLQLAVVCSEDQNYLKHFGFDLGAIKKAMVENEEGKRFRGGSTITQQTAKNVFLWQGRSWIRKGMEVYFTFMIEVLWGKKRILDVYLNVIEMGEGIFGIEKAAIIYFNKGAKNLTRQEAAMIAACLPNPKRYKVKPLSSFVSYRSKTIVRQMNNLLTDPDIVWVTGLPPP